MENRSSNHSHTEYLFVANVKLKEMNFLSFSLSLFPSLEFTDVFKSLIALSDPQRKAFPNPKNHVEERRKDVRQTIDTICKPCYGLLFREVSAYCSQCANLTTPICHPAAPQNIFRSLFSKLHLTLKPL